MNEDRNPQVTEVRETRTVNDGVATRREPAVGVGTLIRRIIYYIAGIIIALLALRIVLLLLAANPASPFVSFIYNLSAVFAWPFFGIFSYQPSYGQSTFEISSIVAIIVYALVALGLGKLFTLGSPRYDVE